MRLSPSLLLTAALAAQGVAAASKVAPAPAKALVCVPTNGRSLCTSSGVVLVNERKAFSVDVPAGSGWLTVRLTPSGGTGDADLEVMPPSDTTAEPKSSREVSGRGEREGGARQTRRRGGSFEKKTTGGPKTSGLAPSPQPSPSSSPTLSLSPPAPTPSPTPTPRPAPTPSPCPALAMRPPS